MNRSACLEAIEGKSSPKSMRLALGRDWSGKPILSLFIAKIIFFRLKAQNWQFAEPSRQSDSSKIVLISSLGTFLLDVNASCKQQRGPVMFNMAFCTEASSFSRFCVYFRDLGGEI